MAETFYKGEEQILYLVVDSIDCPIACLTSNSFSESVEMLDTTTRENAGWKTSKPTNQEYSISFEGLQIITDETTPTRYSLDTLKVLKRARTKIEWKIATGSVFTDTGFGYITELSESAPVGELLSFSGTITGFGEPTETTTFIYEDSDTLIYE